MFWTYYVSSVIGRGYVEYNQFFLLIMWLLFKCLLYSTFFHNLQTRIEKDSPFKLRISIYFQWRHSWWNSCNNTTFFSWTFIWRWIWYKDNALWWKWSEKLSNHNVVSTTIWRPWRWTTYLTFKWHRLD